MSNLYPAANAYPFIGRRESARISTGASATLWTLSGIALAACGGGGGSSSPVSPRGPGGSSSAGVLISQPDADSGKTQVMPTITYSSGRAQSELHITRAELDSTPDSISMADAGGTFSTGGVAGSWSSGDEQTPDDFSLEYGLSGSDWYVEFASQTSVQTTAWVEFKFTPVDTTTYSSPTVRLTFQILGPEPATITTTGIGSDEASVPPVGGSPGQAGILISQPDADSGKTQVTPTITYKSGSAQSELHITRAELDSPPTVPFINLSDAGGTFSTGGVAGRWSTHDDSDNTDSIGIIGSTWFVEFSPQSSQTSVQTTAWAEFKFTPDDTTTYSSPTVRLTFQLLGTEPATVTTTTGSGFIADEYIDSGADDDPAPAVVDVI